MKVSAVMSARVKIKNMFTTDKILQSMHIDAKCRVIYSSMGKSMDLNAEFKRTSTDP